ncbi:Nucleosomal histone H3-Lys79 methylase [Gonapodya sp. JEL0774]|nr:Nucleosomal histone H3-Lys79 methylase [Gonapodya sp. JEL0774]
MGSGIGNVVLQIAATVLCESWGVEVMPYPAKFAAMQKREFLSRMRYYAKPCGLISLKLGDMCEDKDVSEVLKRVDVVYVNNFAFSPQLNQQILDKFLDLKDGTRIISLRAFTTPDRKITLRNANSVESILTVKEYFFGEDMVSWTNEGGKYYIQTVDRSALRKFQESFESR